jgi:hypothetical protein
MINTCNHLHDDGGKCNSAAVTGQKYCTCHLRYRARQLRMAQLRARSQRFDLKLPPLESMHAVQSALTQLAEALAADMIDPKRAQQLLSVLRLASRNLLHSDKWQPSVYHTEVPGPAVDLAAQYGLPPDLDLDTPPEVAFPSPLSPAASETDNWSPATDNCFSSPMPTVPYCKDGPGCPEHTIRADFPETPELAELREIQRTQGDQAVALRYKQQQHNRQRRYVNAAIALESNLRLAAERLAERKLAETHAQEKLAAKKPPASVTQSDSQADEESDLSSTG